jgi:hypothetical protein
MSRFQFARLCVRWFAASLLIMAATARAAEGGFAATLPAEKQGSAGLTALTTTESAALDQFVAAELALARSDGKPEFTGTFVSRRTEAERKAAGLDRLTTAQLEKLNELVATVLNRPQPKERPRLKAGDVLSAARQNRIHGSVTVAYGWGRGGRDMWTESLWLEYYDPERRFGLGIGLSNYDGDGFFGGYPDYFGFYPYYCGFYPDHYSAGYGSRYYSRPPVFLANPAYDAGDRRGDLSHGEAMMLRGDAGGLSLSRGRRRGR